MKVSPRRVAAPVPFEFARVLLPLTRGVGGFKVYAPQHEYVDRRMVAADDGELTRQVFPLDETAKYFLILVALCEPRLRDSSVVAIPTLDQVIDRLRPLPGCASLTRSAVNFHINYLVENKLRVKPADTAEGDRFAARRESLVTVALRFNVTREEHLALLPSPRPDGRPGNDGQRSGRR